jgi:hypothetical protein
VRIGGPRVGGLRLGGVRPQNHAPFQQEKP